jgi:predicted TIM-barrel fold metal-dependent hydrolase
MRSKSSGPGSRSDSCFDCAAVSHSFLTPEYIDRALELFGPERLMFGSDWRVAILRGSYAFLDLLVR